MKICIEAQVLNHNQRSGLMTYTEGLLTSLSTVDAVNEYRLLYYSLWRKAFGMPGPQPRCSEKKVLRFPDRSFKGRTYLLDRFFLPSYLKRQKIDVFHRPSGYSMPDVRGLYKILTVHDLRTLTIGDHRWTQNIELYRRTLGKVDKIVTVSECTRRDLITHFKIDERNIAVIYLAADVRFTPQTKDAVDSVRKKYGLPRPFFLGVGSVPRKNIDGIIRAFGQSRSAQSHDLVLACKFDLEKYKKLCRQLGVAEKVFFLENIAGEDLVKFYSGCEAFIFPSLYEGFGLPILEAMQCGVPVITSNVSSCPEVAGDAAILVDPKDMGAIGEAMDQIVANPALRQDLIAKGFQRAKQFSWDQFGQNMVKIYTRQ